MEEAPAGLEFIETVVNVRYAETDQMGVVYYANYLVWFEVGRVAWCRAKGFHYRDMERDEGKFLVVAEVNCRYRAPARFDDNILIRTAISGATDRVIHFRYEIANEKTRQMLANGESVHVVTGPDLRPSRLPEKYRAIFGLHRTHSPMS